MSVFSALDFDGHEQVGFFHDAASGLRAIIAVHDTSLGPALGGCRMYPYATEAHALQDVLRLSRGMSYKAAIAGVRLGGGKSVIIGDPRIHKTEPLLCSMGRAIESFGGRYIVGEDIGTDPGDMRIIRRETKAVSCLEEEDGGYGDPAPFTALGVFQSIRAAQMFAEGTDDLVGRTVAVQGAGNVGFNLCKLLVESGAKLIVCDPYEANARRAEGLGATIVSPGDIYSADADIFSPCAVGGILNDESIPQLRAKIVAGAANNQTAEDGHASRLRDLGITYVPDYVANAGGLICCAAEWYRTDRTAVRDRVLAIYETCLDILRFADEAGVTTQFAANQIARQRLHGA